MNAKKRRRLYFAAALIAAGGVLAVAIVYGLGNNVLYFYSPSDLTTKHVGPGTAFRIGGLVEKASVHHGAGADVRFTVTDGARAVPIEFNGVLPALFREGQGVVATGALRPDGIFNASEVLAKHDEKYMPPEVVAALKRSGRWKEGE
jgi:cytochrome c-type biogenesis protein CcmE